MLDNLIVGGLCVLLLLTMFGRARLSMSETCRPTSDIYERVHSVASPRNQTKASALDENPTL